MEIGELNQMDAAEFVAALEGIWEHSPWVAETVAAERPFASREALATGMWNAVQAASPERQLALLQAHPDLAGKLARAGVLSVESTAEQGGLGLDRLSDEEFERFSSLNTAYHARFGFPFIICVRNHTRASILEAFTERLENARAQEMQKALDEVRQIAEYRLKDRL